MSRLYDSQNLFIKLEECFCDLLFPNAVTPNFDGLNETFGPTVFCQYLERYHLQIFNRWGERLFDTYSVDDRWDLTFNGIPVQSGAYFYLAVYTGIIGGGPQLKQASGTVNVLR
ncbi:MAG: T9SS type B sorting domain-containing protein [Bacteroidetes bacterium]|nr:T9SS type B sorting domain-containing protein [Bacteroidota bacterium]